MRLTPRKVARAMVRLGEDLRTWRRLQRLTVAQVADRADVSRDTVLRLEKGDSVNLENLLRIARALGVLDQLAGAVDPYESDVGRLRADEALPQRVRPPRSQRP
ncbi:MAG TPA: helix-turn-helix transcriptional regulator [Nitriliruptorales bacterium]